MPVALSKIKPENLPENLEELIEHLKDEHLKDLTVDDEGRIGNVTELRVFYL